MDNIGSTNQKRTNRRGFPLLILGLLLLSVSCLSLVLYDIVIGSISKDQFVPFSIHSILQADYSADLQSTPIALVDLSIIREIIADRFSLDDDDASQLLTDILDQLKTPIPTVTPLNSLIQQPSPTPTLLPTSTPTVPPSRTPTASLSPTLSPTPSLTSTTPPTPTRTYIPYYPTKTPIPPTKTPKPTATRTPTPTNTVEPLSLLLQVSPNLAAIAEPGGTVTYSVNIQNPSSFSITIISLDDDQFGNLDGMGTCAVGITIAAGSGTTCAFSDDISGLGGTTFTNKITAVGEDNLSRSVTVSQTGTVTIQDVLPTIEMNSIPEVSTINEPAEIVTYTLTIVNKSIEPVTLINLTDDEFGDLNGAGDCSTGEAIPVGGTYACKFSGMAGGNAGTTFTNTTTATAADDETSTTSAASTASVNVLDVLPTFLFSLSQSATTVNEPGGDIAYSLLIENTSPEALSIDSLVDSNFGDLNGVGTCAAGGLLISGESYACVFTGAISGNAGDVFTNFITVQASDDEGNTVDQMESAAVTLNDILPSISVTKNSSDTLIYEPGGIVVYTVNIKNQVAEPLVLASLNDSKFGNLDGQGSCSVGGSIPANSTYTCGFSGLVSGNAGNSHTNTIVAVVKDDEGNSASKSDSATVLINNRLPVINASISPLQNTIQEPGGSLGYEVSVENTSVEPVILVSLMDDLFGDLTSLGCPGSVSIPVSATYTCTFTGTLSGNAGELIVNTLIASAQDDEAFTATDTTSSTVTILDVLPAVNVTKSVNLTSVPEPGGEVDFSVIVENLSVEQVALNSLTNDLYGDLSGQGTCNAGANPYPSSLAVGASYSCGFSAMVVGNAGDKVWNVTTAIVEDDENNLAADFEAQDVDISDVLPSIIVTKTSGTTSLLEPGGSASYTIEIGNTSVEAVRITSLMDDMFGDLVGAGTCDNNVIIPMLGSYTCNFSRVINGNAGTIHTNTVTAAVEDDELNTASNSGSTSISFTDAIPGISVSLEPSVESLNEPGGDITYLLSVINTSLEPVTLTSLLDDTFGDLTSKGCTLEPIAVSATYTCAYTETISGLAGDTITNTVVVQALDDESNPAVNSDSASVAIFDSYPIIDVTKTAGVAAIPEPGALVPFTFFVENLSGEPITVTAVMDDQFGNLNADCSIPQPVAIGSNFTCNVTRFITGNAGDTHTNTVMVTAVDFQGNSVSDSDSASVTVMDLTPTINVSQSPHTSLLPEPGGLVTYTVTVHNSSVEDVFLTALVDNQFGNLNGKGSCSTGVAIPLGTSYTCSHQGGVTGNASDVFVNQVTASAEDDELNAAVGSATASVSITDVLPTLVVVKEADPVVISEPGASVSFTIQVENTSVEEITLIELVDDQFGTLNGSGTCGTSVTILVGAVYTCDFSEYLSGNAGDLFTNVVTATIRDDELNPASGFDTAAVAFINVLPSLTVTKTASAAAVFEPGENLTFTVQVENTSVESVALTSLLDDRVGDLNGMGTCNSIANPYPLMLAVSDTYTCQFDAFAGGNAGQIYQNTVTAVVVDDESSSVSASGTAGVNILNLDPQIVVTKTASTGNINEPGGDVTFTVEVENISLENVTLTSLEDNQFGDLTTHGCPLGLITTGAVYTCNFDVPVLGDAGVIHSNTVMVTVEDDDGRSVSVADSESITIVDVLPTITVSNQPGTATLFEPGGSVLYQVQVQNTSPESVVLSSLSSDLFGNLNGQGTCVTGGSVTSGGTYTCAFIGAVSGDAGETITNIVSVQARDNEANVVSASDPGSVSIQDVPPTVSITKSVNKATIEEPGDTVTFFVVVGNPSQENITMTNLVDDFSGDLDGQGTCITAQTLLPGSTYTCSYSDYIPGIVGDVITTTVTVTAQDNELNSANASDFAVVSVSDRPLPTFDLTKTPSLSTIPEPGGPVTFSIDIVNTYSRDFILITLADSVFGDLDGVGSCSTGGLILAGETYSCAFQKTINGNAGYIHTNILTAEVDETGAIGSDSDDATVVISDALPSLHVSKTANVTEVVEPGQEVSFSIDVVNTSYEIVTLTNLNDDQVGPLFGVGSCTTNIPISTGGTYSCTYPSFVGGSTGNFYTNVASAQIQDDEGNTASESASLTLAVVSPIPVDVAGQVRNDLDFDGDLLDPDPGIGGVTLELYDGTCVLGSTCPTSVTNSSGYYLFYGVNPGSYWIFENDLPGYSSTADADGVNDNQILITVISGVNNEGNDFLDTNEAADIYGQVRDDSDGDGNPGDKDSGLAGVTIELDDGICVVGINCRKVTTDSNGYYHFENMISGDYILIENDLPEYISTFDTDPPNDNRIRVTLIRGIDSTGNDFLDTANTSCDPPDPLSGFISSTVPGEGDIVSINTNTIAVVFNQAMSTSGGGSVLDIGNFDSHIQNLTYGGDVPILSVSYNAQTKTATLLLDTSDKDWLPGSQYQLKVKSGIKNACEVQQGVDVLVTFYTQSAINGQVRNDVDVDGDLGDGDDGIPGVTLELEDSACTLGSTCRTTRTDAEGFYRLVDLPADTYTLHQYDLPGYTSTADVDGGDPNQVVVSIGAANYVTGQDFLDTGTCTPPDPLSGFVDSTVPGEGDIVSINTDTIVVVFNQAMSTNVLDKGSFDSHIQNLTYGGDVPILSVSYNAQTKTATLYLDTSDKNWLPGSQYELKIKSGIKNACEVQQGVDVLVTFYTQSAINGQVRNDVDVDGDLGDGDDGIPGVTLELEDSACTLGSTCRTTSTDAGGFYRFVDLLADTYTLHQYDLPGFTSTADVDGGDPNQVTISIGAVNYVSGQDFLDTGTCTSPDPLSGFISSTVPADGEILVQMDTDTLLIYFNQPMATEGGGSVTDLESYHDKIKNQDSDGNVPILSAVYNPETYVATLTLDLDNPDWQPGTWYQLEIDKSIQNACKTNQGISVFVEFQTTSAISGQVRLDSDGDGVFTDDDPGIPGVPVELFDGVCTLGIDCRTYQTNANGFYIFPNVVPGNYTVYEYNLAGYTSTADTEGPNDDQINLTVAPGSLSTRNDFLDSEN